jgi:tRNA pseudouridine38-40 synthase
MPTFKITLAYDGTDFVGWQRQANGVSVQALIEDALHALDEGDVRVTGAGRTDAGVHALGQVAAFTIHRVLAADAIVRALNARLPGAIRVLAAEEVPPTFHPRFGARRKTYRYRIWNGEVISPFERLYAWHVAGALDVGAMHAAAQRLVGRHDFAAFQAAGSEVQTTEREVFVSRIEDGGLRIGEKAAIRDESALRNESARLIESAPRVESALRTPPSAMLSYTVAGDGFLRHMVRIIVGTLVEIGRGRQPVDWIGVVLASRDRRIAGPTAPPEGLFLTSVEYDDALAADP